MPLIFACSHVHRHLLNVLPYERNLNRINNSIYLVTDNYETTIASDTMHVLAIRAAYLEAKHDQKRSLPVF